MNEKKRLRRELSEIAGDTLDFLKTGFRSKRQGGALEGGPAAAEETGAATSAPGLEREAGPTSLAAGLEREAGSTPSAAGSEQGTGPASSDARPREPDAGSTRRELFDAVVRQILTCTKCPLHRGRRNAVPGKGSIDAEVVFIGEGPGETEDIRGEPFVGRAGQLLTKMLAGIDLKREEVYITNIVKCRPPNNRAPLPEESDACFPYLERQLALVDPKIICCLGGPAAQAVLRTNLGITKLRGSFHRYKDTPVVPTYHPAAVLRFPDKYRRDVWNDLKMLRDYLRDLKKS